jgi:membrane-bound serine protease (ClpP class)
LRKIVRGIGVLLLALAAISQGYSVARSESGFVALVPMTGAIDPTSANYIERAIDTAAKDGATLLVIQLDTPGGLVDSTRAIMEAILGSPVPIVVYVAPAGAQAASAGTFVTAAAHVAAMAPATNIGAAAVVGSEGAELGPTLKEKATQDAMAMMRSVAELRGRNAEALELTVTEAKAYSASEALELGIVDLIAADLDGLLTTIDGRTVTTASGEVTIHSAGVPVKEIPRNLVERFLGVVASPNVVFILLSVGLLAISAELFSPGVFGPGIAGFILVGLAFVGLGLLPVNWFGVGLIVFAGALMYFEVQVSGVGAFGVGAVVCFALGGLMLFGGIVPSPEGPWEEAHVSRWLIVAMTAFFGSVLAFFVFMLKEGGSSSGYPSATHGGLVGAVGMVMSDLNPSGEIRVGEAEWTATTDTGNLITKGTEVEVVGDYVGGVVKVIARQEFEEMRSVAGWLDRLRGRWRRSE